MRDTVWNYIYFWQYNILYYGRVRHKLERRNSRLKFGSALFTIIVIAFWGSYPRLFVLWTVLVTLSQVISLYAECTKLSEKVMRLRFWAEDAQKIANKITALWDEIDEIPDSEMCVRIQTLRDEWSTLDARFLQGIDPYNSKVRRLAEEEAHDLLKNVYIANHEADAESKQEVTI